MAERQCPPHVPTPDGEECCVGHHDESPGGCFRCLHCRHYIRPHKANDPCNECIEADNIAKGLCPAGHPAVEASENTMRCTDSNCMYKKWSKDGSTMQFEYPGGGQQPVFGGGEVVGYTNLP